jgi:hypothetical protein
MQARHGNTATIIPPLQARQPSSTKAERARSSQAARERKAELAFRHFPPVATAQPEQTAATAEAQRPHLQSHQVAPRLQRPAEGSLDQEAPRQLHRRPHTEHSAHSYPSLVPQPARPQPWLGTAMQLPPQPPRRRPATLPPQQEGRAVRPTPVGRPESLHAQEASEMSLPYPAQVLQQRWQEGHASDAAGPRRAQTLPMRPMAAAPSAEDPDRRSFRRPLTQLEHRPEQTPSDPASPRASRGMEEPYQFLDSLLQRSLESLENARSDEQTSRQGIQARTDDDEATVLQLRQHSAQQHLWKQHQQQGKQQQYLLRVQAKQQQQQELEEKRIQRLVQQRRSMEEEADQAHPDPQQHHREVLIHQQQEHQRKMQAAGPKPVNPQGVKVGGGRRQPERSRSQSLITDVAGLIPPPPPRVRRGFHTEPALRDAAPQRVAKGAAPTGAQASGGLTPPTQASAEPSRLEPRASATSPGPELRRFRTRWGRRSLGTTVAPSATPAEPHTGPRSAPTTAGAVRQNSGTVVTVHPVPQQQWPQGPSTLSGPGRLLAAGLRAARRRPMTMATVHEVALPPQPQMVSHSVADVAGPLPLQHTTLLPAVLEASEPESRTSQEDMRSSRSGSRPLEPVSPLRPQMPTPSSERTGTPAAALRSSSVGANSRMSWLQVHRSGGGAAVPLGRTQTVDGRISGGGASGLSGMSTSLQTSRRRESAGHAGSRATSHIEPQVFLESLGEWGADGYGEIQPAELPVRGSARRPWLDLLQPSQPPPFPELPALQESATSGQAADRAAAAAVMAPMSPARVEVRAGAESTTPHDAPRPPTSRDLIDEAIAKLADEGTPGASGPSATIHGSLYNTHAFTNLAFAADGGDVAPGAPLPRWPPPAGPALTHIRGCVYGCDAIFETPFGKREMVYADYAAMGRLLRPVEEWLARAVYPTFANAFGSIWSNSTGATERLLEDAREVVARFCGAPRGKYAVMFVGGGVTGAVRKLAFLLGIHPKGEGDAEKPVVFISTLEHHANVMFWQAMSCELVVRRLSCAAFVCRCPSGQCAWLFPCCPCMWPLHSA